MERDHYEITESINWNNLVNFATSVDGKFIYTGYSIIDNDTLNSNSLFASALSLEGINPYDYFSDFGILNLLDYPGWHTRL